MEHSPGSRVFDRIKREFPDKTLTFEDIERLFWDEFWSHHPRDPEIHGDQTPSREFYVNLSPKWVEDREKLVHDTVIPVIAMHLAALGYTVRKMVLH